MNTTSASPVTSVWKAFNQVGVFGKGMWRYWHRGESAPDSNFLVQKLFAFTDGRSNDILFRILESRRRETPFRLGWEATSIVGEMAGSDPSIEEAARTLREDGVVVLPRRLKPETVDNLHELALSGEYETTIYGALPTDQSGAGMQVEMPIAERGTTHGIDPLQPHHSVYLIRREQLVKNSNIQALLCDPYLLAVATRYLGVFPVVTKPDMWWDTECLPPGLRPRPFHVDSGCLRWLKVGINLTETTLDTPHFVYVKGSHNPNPITRPLTKRLASRMNLSDKEVRDLCPDKIVHITAPAGSIMLADTRGIHKGEVALRGNRLILYFGLEGSAFNNIDRPTVLNQVSPELAKAMSARPFSYQFFRVSD
jgi:hypothetical protein